MLQRLLHSLAPVASALAGRGKLEVCLEVICKSPCMRTSVPFLSRSCRNPVMADEKPKCGDVLLVFLFVGLHGASF